jgi:hypothetical protein
VSFPEWVPHFENFAIRVGKTVLSLWGYGPVAVLVSVAAFLLRLSAEASVIYKSAAKRSFGAFMNAVRSAISPTLQNKITRLTIAAWLAVIVGAIVVTVYRDYSGFRMHIQMLEDEKNKLLTERDDWKKKAEDKGKPDKDSTSSSRLQIMYNGSKLNGSTIETPSVDGLELMLSRFNIKNDGPHDTPFVTMRLYFSKGVTLNLVRTPPIWEFTDSDEPNAFPGEYFSANGSPSGPVIHVGETWNWEPFPGRIVHPEDAKVAIRAKVKIFYGASRPAEAIFSVKTKH